MYLCLFVCLSENEQKFGNAKRIIRSGISKKDIQYNDQNEKGQTIMNKNHTENRHRATRTH